MYDFLTGLNIFLILLVLAVSLFILSKSADYLVDNAVKLSEMIGLPEIIIGATIVSLGTTLPELSASIVSALQGNSGFALGNAVGSIITNTSLILGVGALFGAIPVDKKTSKKIGIFIMIVLLLIVPVILLKGKNWDSYIPQWMGFVYIAIIPVYLYYLVRQEKKNSEVRGMKHRETGKIFLCIFKILAAALIIALSSSSLVASAEILAERIHIPDVIISSTLVAFGTSVPELSTCIAAVKNKHGGLAIGNILGANILNVLFVIGVSDALTKGGIAVTQSFFMIHFVSLIIILAVFGYFAFNKKINEIQKKEGIVLILFYILYLCANLLSIRIK